MPSCYFLCSPPSATNALLGVLDGGTSLASLAVDQQQAPADFIDQGVGWSDLGVFSFSSGTLVVQLSHLADGFVLADAVRIERIA
jgi:hypothetical protein